MKMPTLKDIALRASVSPSTVSRVLSVHSAISKATKAAVLAAMHETGYQPNPAARAMVSRRPGDFPISVEVVLCHLDPLDDKPAESFQSVVLRGVHDAISRDGRADFRLSYIQNGLDVEPQLPRLRRVNGVLLMGGSDRALCEGDLLLLDAGVEAQSLYTADITRTLPVSGTFTAEQREIYQLVQDAQEAALAKARNDCIGRTNVRENEAKAKPAPVNTVLVATASLELCIDIGDVDLACQIGSTRSINA